MRNYYIELHANGKKEGSGFKGFDSACAHFSTTEKPATKPFVLVMMKAIKKIGGQQVAHGWVHYAVGKLFIQCGSEPVSAMSPAWEYRTPASMTTPIWEEYKEDND